MSFILWVSGPGPGESPPTKCAKNAGYYLYFSYTCNYLLNFQYVADRDEAHRAMNFMPGAIFITS
jgi:hypothetical protein